MINTASPALTACLNNSCASVAAHTAWCGANAMTSTYSVCVAAKATTPSCLSGACVSNAVYNDCGADMEVSTH
jgi:hypothetical protein